MSDALEKAAQGIIDVRFTLSTSDLKVLVRLDPDRPFYIILTLFSRLGAFALATALTGAAVLASGLVERNHPEVLTLAIAGGLVGIAAFRLLVERTWRQRIRKSLFQPTRSMHVTGDGQALTVEDEHVSSRIAFSGIDHLIEAPTHLVFYQDRAAILALPKTAFENQEIFAVFTAFLQSIVVRDTAKPHLKGDPG